MSAPSSAVIRRRQRRWWYYGSTDPLGAGNTKLIADLGVTPIAFYDVRQNLTVAGGTASSLADVSGIGTYGPALVQATGTKQPTWNGTTLNFDGASQWLGSAAAVPGLDISQPLTAVVVMDTTVNTPKNQVTAFNGAGQSWSIATGNGATPGHYYNNQTTNASGPVSTVTVGGGLRCILSFMNSGTAQTTEIPNTPLVSDSSPGSALTAGNASLSLGAWGGSVLSQMTFRALLIFAGNYTAAQRDTIKTWAVLRHAAILAGGLLMIALGSGRYAATTDTTVASAAYVTNAGTGRFQLDTAVSSGVQVDLVAGRPTVSA